MADNWYVVLELEFDPPIEDEKIIAAKIEEKKISWSGRFNDSMKGAQYRTWVQQVDQIKKDMIGEDNKRKQLAAEACTIAYAPVDKALKTIGRKGYISDDEGNKLAKSKNISIDIVKKRATQFGIEWRKDTIDYQAIYDKYYKTRPPKFHVYSNDLQMLESFNADSFYNFLYAETDTNTNDLTCDMLLQKTAEKKATFKKNDSISGTGKKICGKCELAFKNEASKAEYDVYLEYTKRKSLLDEFKSMADYTDIISKEQMELYIGQLTGIIKNRELAENIIIALCKIETIKYYTPDPPKNIKVCRCGCINNVSDGRKVCSNCGLELEISCPICGTINDAIIKVCKCGFKFENIDRALALCEQAEHAIDALNFSVARAHLSDAKRYWPKSKKVEAIEVRLVEFEKRVGKEATKMREAIDKMCYCEARSMYTKLQNIASDYSDAALEYKFNQAITNAQALFKQAKASKTEKDILELCAQAYDYCADLPGIKELMPAPPKVTGMAVSANNKTKINIVSWNVTNDKSVKYIVVKSTNGWIQHIADGEIVYRGSANSYPDKDIEAGVTYYYNVFTERAGIYSEGTKGESVVNFFEISNVFVTAANASLNIAWDSLPENATAEIYEILSNGSKKQIATSSSNCFLVSGLENGITYSYHIALSYIVNGKKQLTEGVNKTGIPDCPPEPIYTLRVKPLNDDSFEALWTEKESSEVRLFGSKQKPKYSFGDIVSLSAIEQEMIPLQMRPLSSKTTCTMKPNEKGACFQYSGSEVMYVVAVVVKSGSVVFGSIARASRGETVNIKAVRPVNGQINIFIDAPRAATGFIVLYRFDKFPSDISDTNTIRQYVPLKQYQENSTIVLDTFEPKKYFFSVFAEFKFDGEKDYSSASDCLFDNSPKVCITYSISVNKKKFGESAVVLEFEADKREFDLPAIDVMSAIGNVPMFKKSAKLFWSIPSQHVTGTLNVRIPLQKEVARETFIKAFFKDEDAQNGNQLQLKVKSNYKIN